MRLWIAAIGLALQAREYTTRFVEPPLGRGFEYLAIDGTGQIWVGGDRRVVRFDGVRFTEVPVTGGVAEVVDSPDGFVYITTSTGLWRAKGERVELVHAKPHVAVLGVTNGAVLVNESTIEIWRPGVGITASVTPSPGTLGWPGRGQAGDVLIPRGNSILRLRRSDLEQNRIQLDELPGSRHPEASDWIWAATDSSGITWMRSQLTLGRLDERGQTQIVNRRTTLLFWAAFQDITNGDIWFPQLSVNGVDRLGLAHNGVLSLPDEALVPIIVAARRGKDGTLWTITGERLAYVPMQGRLRNFSTDEGLEHETATRPGRLNGQLYAASTDAIYKFDEQASRFRPEHRFAGGIPASDSLTHGADVVITMLRGFLLAWHPGGGPPRAVPAPPRPTGPTGATHLAADAQGHLWAAYGDGVARLDKQLRPVEFLAAPGDVRPVDMFFDRENRLWTALRTGVGLYHDGKWRFWGTKEGLNAGVRTLTWYEGSLWIGYAVNGDTISRLSPTAGGDWKLEHLKGPGGTRFLRVDERGWLWRGTISRGVQVCQSPCGDPAQWIDIFQRDGAASDETGQNMWTDDAVRKHVWWMTTKGLSRLEVEPDLFTRNPDPLLTVETPRLSGGAWKLRWASAYYRHPSAVQVRYRLTPRDADWTYVSAWETEFRNLGWGQHTFEVQARAGRGDWHPAMGSATIAIAFPYTSQFLYTGGGLGALSFGAWWRRRSTRAARVRYEKLKSAVNQARAIKDPAPFLSSLDPSLRNEVQRMLQHADDPLPAVLPEVPPEDWAGLTLAGRYLLEHRVARGGFATVYRARDLRMSGRPTAIKILDQPASETWGEALDRELEVLSRLHHPGVVAVFDRGSTPWRQAFLALEFIEGRTLRQYLGSPVDAAQGSRWMAELASALDAIHAAGVVHRDLKPENLMVRQSTAGSQLVVIDLGIATLRRRNRNSVWITRAAGSLDYMAPEQLHGVASPAADVYSFALICVELMTGQRVAEFAAANSLAVPEAGAALVGANATATIVQRALSYVPGERHSSAGGLWRELVNSRASS